jgi:hypothetical protein
VTAAAVRNVTAEVRSKDDAQTRSEQRKDEMEWRRYNFESSRRICTKERCFSLEGGIATAVSGRSVSSKLVHTCGAPNRVVEQFPLLWIRYA